MTQITVVRAYNTTCLTAGCIIITLITIPSLPRALRHDLAPPTDVFFFLDTIYVHVSRTRRNRRECLRVITIAKFPIRSTYVCKPAGGGGSVAGRLL